MAWRRLGMVALEVVKASAAAAERAREVERAIPAAESAPAARPTLFTRVAVFEPAASRDARVSAAA